MKDWFIEELKDKPRNDNDFNTINQIKTILSNVRYDIPSIVVGDFNLLVESESIKMFDSKSVQAACVYVREVN